VFYLEAETEPASGFSVRLASNIAIMAVTMYHQGHPL